jgi:hypothetical protein
MSEFIEKWKKGIAMVTPMQSMKATQKGNWVMLIGFVCGIIVMLSKIKDFWWIEIILCAGLFNHIIMMIGIAQKINLLSKFEAGE